ncbi:MAG: CDP-diacylglycerol--glycerol-3-phosphate 3-phosphatidyltransferase [Eubacterium sp.]|nr:CDP-diacylglycerol--glycerol-3-phosphate 3-phosphatidyltransferase [Eubacterium sp.]
MNLPNKLTVFRVILIPVFVFFMLMPEIPGAKWYALFFFCLASVTDFFDGYLARKNNLVTDFGKFMDPLADKLLICSALIALCSNGRFPAWIVIIIIAREFTISGFRLIASDNGRVISASMWGKVKTVVQMFTVIMLIMDLNEVTGTGTTGDGAIYVIEQCMIYLALGLTVISLIDYIWKNKDVISTTK